MKKTTFGWRGRSPRRAVFKRRRTGPPQDRRRGDGTAVRLFSPGAVLHVLPHQVVARVGAPESRCMSLTTSPRANAHDLRSIRTGRWRKTARSHAMPCSLAADRPIDRHRLPVNTWVSRRLFASSPGTQHFDGAAHRGHVRQQHVVVDYQHSTRDRLSQQISGVKALDHHVAGTKQRSGRHSCEPERFLCAHPISSVWRCLPV